MPSRFTEELAGGARCLVCHPINPPYLIPAIELVPAPLLVVCELEAGRYVERQVAEAGRTTLVEKPFPIEVDPGRLVQPRG